MRRFFAIILCIIAGYFLISFYGVSFVALNEKVSLGQKLGNMLFSLVIAGFFMGQALWVGRFYAWKKVTAITIVSSSVVFLLLALNLLKNYKDENFLKTLQMFNNQIALEFFEDFPDNVSDTATGLGVIIVFLCIAIGLMVSYRKTM